MLDIITRFDDDRAAEFRRLKRRTGKGSWMFLMRGEWASNWMAQGNVTFDMRIGKDGRCWSLLSRGVPTRVEAVAVATDDEPHTLEEIAARLVEATDFAGGPRIDDIEDTTDELDWEAFQRWRNA